MNLFDLVVGISSDISGLVKGVEDSEKAMKTLADKADKLGGELSKKLTLPILAIGTAFIKSAADSEKSQAAFTSALKQTGQTATVSLKEMNKFAASLQQTTKFEDDAIISSQALLVRLGGLTENGLKKVTPAVLDFATAMNIDLDSAATLVAKTIGTSTNALGRYGIELKDGLDPTEKLAEVTRQLSDKFGGAAVAAGETFGGKLTILKNSAGDLAENFGGILIPALTDLVNAVKPMVEGFANLDDGTKKIIIGIAGIAAAIGPAIKAIGFLDKAFQLLKANPIFLVVGAVAALAVALGELIPPAAGSAEALDDVAKSTENLRDEVLKNSRLSDEIIGPVDELTKANKLSAEQVLRLTALYPELSSKLVAGKTSIEDYTKLQTALRYEQLRQIEATQLQAYNEGLLAKQRAIQAATAYQNQSDAAKSAAGLYGITAKSFLDSITKQEESLKNLQASLRQTQAEILANAKAGQTVNDVRKQGTTILNEQTDASKKLKEQEEARLKKEEERGAIQVELDRQYKDAKIEQSEIVKKLQEDEQRRLAAQVAAKDAQTLLIQKEKDELTALGLHIVTHSDLAASSFEAGFEAAFRNVANDAKIWSDITSKALNGAASAFESVFETLGEGIVTGQLSWESLGQVALGVIADILRGLGEQLLAKSIAYFIEAAAASASVIGLPLAPGLAAAGGIMAVGAAGAFASAGIIKALSATIPTKKYAMGTDFAPGGVAMVGEQGRELVTLPRGASVLPNARTEALLKSQAQGVTVTNNFYSPKALDPYTMDKMARRQDRRLRAVLNG
jgi:hypothetical protein